MRGSTLAFALAVALSSCSADDAPTDP